MLEYYRRRAAELERVYARPERQAELRALEVWLAGVCAGRHVLELACGTAWWTPHGARACASWLATDANEELLALARRKPLPPGRVRFARLDAYALHALDDVAPPPGGRFDAAFAGFWWSHVPLARLAPWLQTLHARLAPGARVAFVDNRFVAGSSTPIARRDADGNGYQLRTLDDGSVHEVLKNHPARAEALSRLGPRVREVHWHETTHYWRLDYVLA